MCCREARSDSQGRSQIPRDARGEDIREDRGMLPLESTCEVGFFLELILEVDRVGEHRDG